MVAGEFSASNCHVVQVMLTNIAAVLPNYVNNSLERKMETSSTISSQINGSKKGLYMADLVCWYSATSCGKMSLRASFSW